jgi:hypothetical protein
MKWVAHGALIGEKRKSYHVLVVKLRPLGRIKGRCKDNAKGILKKRDKTASTKFVRLRTRDK